MKKQKVVETHQLGLDEKKQVKVGAMDALVHEPTERSFDEVSAQLIGFYPIKLLLILLVCLPMASTDIFIPALPEMVVKLQTDMSTLSLILSSYMIGFSLSVLFGGVLSDFYGRKNILILSMGLYLLSCFLIIFCHDIYYLIFLRFFQGLGGGTGTVIGRLILKDSFKDKEQLNMMSTLSTGMALAPAIAPQIGALCIKYSNWQSCFLFSFVIGLFVLYLLIFKYNETKQIKCTYNPIKALPASFFSGFKDRSFLGYTILIGFAWCAYFNFIGLSSFLFQKTYLYSENKYAFVIALVTFGYLLGTSFTRVLNQKNFKLQRIIKIGVIICLFSSFIFALAYFVKLPFLVIAAMICLRFGIGLIMPTSQVGAMRVYSENTGWYMGCLFFIEFLLGSTTLYAASLMEKMAVGFGMTVSIVCYVIVLLYGLYLIQPQKRKSIQS